MRTGHASVTFAVPAGTAMGGYADRDGGATSALSPLKVHALTWYDGTSRAALVVIDVICVNRDLVDATRRLLPGAGHVTVAATHTHSGPETGCLPGGASTPEPWLGLLSAAAADAVRQAAAAERPSSATLHTGQLRDVGAQRSIRAPEPAVPVDAVAVRTDGEVAGVLIILPVHPTVLPSRSRLTSPDLPGAVRQAMRALLPPDAWCVVATGAAGDVSTRHTRQGQDAAELERLGGIVAARCRQLLDETGTVAWGRSSGLSWRTRELVLPTRPRPAGLIPAQPGTDSITRARALGARIALETTPPGEVPIELTVLRAGSLNVVALPGEPFVGAARWLSTKAGDPTVTLGYANGYPGYLPFADSYRQGEYETLVSVFAPGTLETILDTTAEML